MTCQEDILLFPPNDCLISHAAVVIERSHHLTMQTS